MLGAIRQVVAGQLHGAIKGGVHNAIGGLKGMIGSGTDSSSMASLRSKSTFYTENLAYPLNVEGDPMQGHYILFHINKTIYPDIKTERADKNMKHILGGVKKELKGKVREGRSFRGVEALEGPEATSNLAIEDSNSKLATLLKTGSKESAIKSAPANAIYRMHGPQSKRVATSIALYMPPNVAVSYTPNYSDVDVGGFAGAIVGTVDLIEKAITGNLKPGEGETLGKSAFDNATDVMKKAAYRTMDTVAPGIRALMQIKSGRIISNKMELSFEGVSRRDFTYTFIFIPKSEREAKVVEQIIYMFKYHALPEFAGGYHAKTQDEMSHRGASGAHTKSQTGRSMTIPDTFDIEYMYQSKANNFLNKISTCFCTNVSVQYGGDRFVAYNQTKGIFGAGNPPQRTTLTLAFKEMEIITKQRVAQGY